MESTTPTAAEFEELLEFLPRFKEEGFKPTVGWEGDVTNEDGALTMPFPKCRREVHQFIEAVSKACWCPARYDMEQARRIVLSPDAIGRAGFDQLRAALTFCIRSERFCDGHVGAMIERGVLQALLRRLEKIHRGSTNASDPGSS